MAVLTRLCIADARRLGARFGLEVAGVTGIRAGSVNSNYVLDLVSGARALLRLYEVQSSRAVRSETMLLEHLAARGVATPMPLPCIDGGFVAEHGDKPVVVLPWVDGEVVCQARVTEEHARQVGAALGRLHVAGADFGCDVTERFGPAQLIARLDALPSSARCGSVGDAVPRLRAHLEARLTAPARLPEGLVHGDLFRDNVLWRGDRIAALLDFESASRGAYAFDLAVAVLAWSFGDGLELSLARAMVGGYRAERAPTATELDGFFDEAIFAATRFAVTRITDFELRPRGAVGYKDFRRFLARLDALEALGPRGLGRALGLDG